MKRKSCNTRFSNLRTTQSWWSLQLRRSKQAIRISNWFYQRLHCRMKNREYSPMLELFSRAQRFNSWLSSVCILPVAFFTVTFLWFLKEHCFPWGEFPASVLLKLFWWNWSPRQDFDNPSMSKFEDIIRRTSRSFNIPPRHLNFWGLPLSNPPTLPPLVPKLRINAPPNIERLCVINKYCWR